MSIVVERKLFAEGKTKQLRNTGPSVLDIYSKDDLTAGNGKKHDILEGKGVLATETTCNVFELLHRNGVPVAYMRRTGLRTFEARECKMVKLEVVVRGEAGGSYLKRHPNAKKGYRFKTPLVEYYLKTSGKRWRGANGVERKLPVDDPYLFQLEEDTFAVFDPGRPIYEQEPLLNVSFAELGLTKDDLLRIKATALQAFEVLRRAWRQCSKGRLKDVKIEFGWYTVGKLERPVLLVADVVDNDSWRLDIEGREVSKEVYRQGADLAYVLECYQLVAERSGRFKDLAA